MKHAFTLIELLVVIGIIGILAGILMSTSMSATESARATRCLNNLRSLANACSAYSMEGKSEKHYPTNGGYFPLAGSLETCYSGPTGDSFGEFVGWLSWLSYDYPFGKPGEDKAASSHQHVENCPYWGTGDQKRDHFIFTHGAIWKAVGKTTDVFVCPTHKRLCGQHGVDNPLFSYQMNAYFGYDQTQGQGDSGLPYEVESSYGKKSGGLARADRVLLFAEIPATVDKGSGVALGDSILNYHATVKGTEYGADWKGKAESIGFNHPGPGGKMVKGKNGALEMKGKWFAHVVFADGHTERLQKSGQKGLKDEELTALLCNGKDVAFGAGGWEAVDNGKVY